MSYVQYSEWDRYFYINLRGTFEINAEMADVSAAPFTYKNNFELKEIVHEIVVALILIE